jgi:hypothetical protein
MKVDAFETKSAKESSVMSRLSRLSRLIPAAALSLVILAPAVFAQPYTPGIDYRQEKQQHRIANGVNSGALTARERARLGAEQAAIRRMENRARADGVVTGHERARIHHAQNHASRDIYRQQHDRQVRR